MNFGIKKLSLIFALTTMFGCSRVNDNSSSLTPGRDIQNGTNISIQTPTPTENQQPQTFNKNGANSSEVQAVITESNNLISEINKYLQNQNVSTTQPIQTPSNSDNNRLIKSNADVTRATNRLNHNIEIERLKELGEVASPYTYYNPPKY